MNNLFKGKIKIRFKLTMGFLGILISVAVPAYFLLMYVIHSSSSPTTIWVEIFIIVMGAVCAVVTLTYILTRYFVRDIGTLLDIIHEVSKGNLNVTFPARLFERKDEFGILTRSFYEMTKQLRDVKENLETQVREKTQEVVEAREKLESIILNIPDVVWSADKDAKLIYISEDVFKVFGYTAQEMIENPKKSWFDNVHQEDSEKTSEAYRMLFEDKKPFDIKYRFQRKDGKWIWIHDRAITTYVKNGQVYADGIFSDVTEEMRIENERQRLLDIINKTPDFVGTSDLEGNVLFVNEGGRELVGLELDADVLDMKVANFLPGEFAKIIKEEAMPKAMKDGIWLGENKLLHQKTDEEIAVSQILIAHTDDLGRPRYFSTIIRDIRSLKNAEANLTKRTQELAQANVTIEREKVKDEAVLLSIGEGLIVTDREGNVEFVNRVFKEMLGWESEEVIGKDISDIIPMLDAETKMNVPFKEQILSNVLSSKEKEVSKKVYYFEKKNGKKFPVQISVSPIIMGEKVVGAVEVFRDITHEMEVDRAKTEFVSLASHQLRTPLSTIGWYAEMLLAGDAGKLKGDQESYVEEIYRGNKRMVALVNALLNVSRMELGTFIVEPKPTDIIKLAESVIFEFKPQTKERKLKIKTNFGDDIPLINVDPQLLRIIYQNLLSNSIKYTNDGGSVELEVKKQKDSIFIRVTDDGMGIPDYQKDYIFDKLFRADNVKEKETDGTGLGLYLVKQILDHSGGSIRFESEKDKDTVFIVELPLGGMNSKTGSKQLSSNK